MKGVLKWRPGRRAAVHPVIAVFAEELGSDQWVVRYRDEEGQMGWFHRKQNPGTGATIDTPIHGETTIVLTATGSEEPGRVIGHIVFREGAPAEPAVGTFTGLTVPGQSESASAPKANLGSPLDMQSGATTSSQDPTPGSPSGATSQPASGEAASDVAAGLTP